MTSYLPLFPGYVFLLADADERLAALSTRRVARALDVTEQERAWADLRQIHRLLSLGETVRGESQLAPGSRVEIRNGPLSGLRGKILKQASGDRFVVEVDFIQRGASILLDGGALELTDTEAVSLE